MKNLLFILAIIISSFSFAQGNLQFNQVLTFEGQFTGPASPWFKTPIGKVWKIENSFMTSSINANKDLVCNGITVSRNNSQSSPIWINDQDSIQLFMGGNVSNTYFISIIEFNVVP